MKVLVFWTGLMAAKCLWHDRKWCLSCCLVLVKQNQGQAHWKFWTVFLEKNAKCSFLASVELIVLWLVAATFKVMKMCSKIAVPGLAPFWSLTVFWTNAKMWAFALVRLVGLLLCYVGLCICCDRKCWTNCLKPSQLLFSCCWMLLAGFGRKAKVQFQWMKLCVMCAIAVLWLLSCGAV